MPPFCQGHRLVPAPIEWAWERGMVWGFRSIRHFPTAITFFIKFEGWLNDFRIFRPILNAEIYTNQILMQMNLLISSWIKAVYCVEIEIELSWCTAKIWNARSSGAGKPDAILITVAVELKSRVYQTFGCPPAGVRACNCLFFFPRPIINPSHGTVFVATFRAVA